MKGDKFQQNQIQRVRNEFRQAQSYATDYQDNAPISHFFRTRIRRVNQLLSDFETGRVLDIGCGPAVIGNSFRGKSIDYFGVDVCNDMINMCVSSFENDERFHFSIGNIEKLGFRNACFNVVLCLGVLEYVLDCPGAIQEVARVLKPNGVFIATMHNPKSPYRIWDKYVYEKFINEREKLGQILKRTKVGSDTDPGVGSKQPLSAIYSEKTFLQLLTTAGLKTEDVLYYDFNLFPPPLDVKMASISVSMSRRLEFLCRSKLKFLGTGFMIKSRKFVTT